MTKSLLTFFLIFSLSANALASNDKERNPFKTRGFGKIALPFTHCSRAFNKIAGAKYGPALGFAVVITGALGVWVATTIIFSRFSRKWAANALLNGTFRGDLPNHMVGVSLLEQSEPEVKSAFIDAIEDGVFSKKTALATRLLNTLIDRVTTRIDTGEWTLERDRSILQAIRAFKRYDLASVPHYTQLRNTLLNHTTRSNSRAFHPLVIDLHYAAAAMSMDGSDAHELGETAANMLLKGYELDAFKKPGGHPFGHHKAHLINTYTYSLYFVSDDEMSLEPPRFSMAVYRKDPELYEIFYERLEDKTDFPSPESLQSTRGAK